ncbi:hypothetical protein G7B40_039330 [Aetokthonos hydrillicola Thurmond2011]|jgi:hypothetical protein|uniref:Uncharacterized protein n=1 Tax=Aetokthonos hydrillicola Thurmond2011 TaxID=2712845 RepID=A0AAP5MCP8_9CYAN|nr:hypothetical protein [Aetokthonos hydrillicola]MBO3463464.1 hypothetical protein [Aetokthonos hydrillicola CCALA 1050]MBW4591158.1 hypothetical protein [Aetokthonos hydrillicola CCALA 1050]MDR9900545.1 hypothetical protein [Aetokthonos hydrillicola Thurmond2011]
MTTQTIPDTPAAPNTRADFSYLCVLPELTKEQIEQHSHSCITIEWIQSLPPELKDAALYRLCKVVEAKPTLVESFTLNQVLYRTISGNTFTESADNVAARTGCDRKTILKGLNQAVEQNILEKNERPGTSTEYSFKPVEEWLPEPVVRKTDIRTKKVVEFPGIQGTEEVGNEPQLASIQGVVHNTDYPETDTPSIWRSNPDGSRYAQVPPIYDQEIGVEIQRQMDEEGLTAQSVVGRAIAFSKVPLMLLEMLANIGRKLAEGFSHVEFGSPKSIENKVSTPVTAPTTPITRTFDTSVELEEIEIDELSDVMTQIKLQLRIPIETGFKDSIKRNWKGDTHFNNALAWCVDTAEWLESQNKLERERLFGMLINAMKNDKKPNNRPSPEKLENASAYAPKQPGQQPTQQQLQKLCEAKEKGLIRDLFDSAGDGVLKVIDRLGFAMPWYEWLGLQPN